MKIFPTMVAVPANVAILTRAEFRWQRARNWGRAGMQYNGQTPNRLSPSGRQGQLGFRGHQYEFVPVERREERTGVGVDSWDSRLAGISKGVNSAGTNVQRLALLALKVGRFWESAIKTCLLSSIYRVC
jgi:hypothetical protein